MSETEDMLARDPGSFRDPAGYVVASGQRIFRVIAPAHAPIFRRVLDTGAVSRLADAGRIVATRVVTLDEIPAALAASVAHGALVLEHQRINLITYPYEWSFEMLRGAALAHLDLHLTLLEQDLTLSDASAFNVQFDGALPVFIDPLSIVPYEAGQLWQGYDQFCREFLNPLLIESATGVSPAAHYRGALSGPGSRETLRLLPALFRWRPVSFMHVAMPARVKVPNKGADVAAGVKPVMSNLPKGRFIALLQHLRRSIAALARPKDLNETWSGYATDNSYQADEARHKAQVVRDWAAARRPAVTLDLGCNTGAISDVVLASGGQRVIAVDYDRASIDLLYTRARYARLPVQVLTADLANPSPAQGWRGMERQSLMARLKGDGAIALALIHHLVIGRNLPMDEVIAMLVDRAPTGLIEFVPKADPMVQSMLSLRRDIFPSYSIENFAALLDAHARIVRQTQVSASGRVVFEYQRA